MAWAEPKIWAYLWEGRVWSVEIERMEEAGAEKRWTLRIFLGDGVWDAPGTFADAVDAAVAVVQRETGYQKWDERPPLDESPPKDLDKWEKDYDPIGDDDDEPL
jgi:hypothetical protein